ncbi:MULTISPECIES: LuxR family transcriptional regulator [unclassified Mesorhizobium]|uniref:LuxR family transcriptional regulator n=2 Tax=Mesorhizobium TaxID=68287 RepID=UPI000F75C8C0|nr:MULTISPECIES: LuxR family transcriptional regulator [unclassified Mesorhizobium]TGP44570.1 LuxR family transcriptional regulator [bacterium M00.F.Ca.ET.230.01.1.1]TGP72958.1 LuxR family transcriptional regulator [bacterium M00.F.Ca.ET.227.01.1.1]TGP99672.1 LuxR family transcriptional regulator [bacterium M00.F.Ca.ET.221.01.1.1]TGQ00401.1 LuxR family transcriptional regulator [bacterium M00.F.Ca.ET.222.01.1.1]TGT78854.1 LuxR family transcriptional regulator [bacterium M00.F.Ca.ET.159.01.1.1]
MTRDMPLVFETFLERLSQSVDEADFRDAMAEAAGRLDLIFFAYLSLPARPSGKPRLISNYPPRWTRQYLENQYEKLDPVVLRARNGGCPFHWGSNFGGDKMSPAQQQLFDEAAQFSICCGLTIPIVDLRGRIAAVTFAADEPRPVFLRVAERYEQALQLMAACFHRCVRRKLPSDRTVDGISLTSREYECLRWAARGNSAWVTGRILGIKPRTIAFHLDNAKKKLGVRTQNQAIALLGSEGSSIL